MFMTTIKLETNQRRFTCNHYLFISTVIVVTPYVRVHKVYLKKLRRHCQATARVRMRI